MKKRQREHLQKGEAEFINNVVKAVVSKDVSKVHYLVDDNGLMRYVSFVVDQANPIVDLKYENGKSAKVVCVFSEELIEDAHFKAGNDDLTKPWITKAVKSVIAHGKQVAEEVYKNIDHN